MTSSSKNIHCDEIINVEEEENDFEVIERLELGVKVSSEQAAYDIYNQHALRRGFSIRKGNKRKPNGVLRQLEFLCSKEGHRSVGDSAQLIRRLETREGCKARITFTISNGVWEVTKFNDTHNHPMASEEEKHNLRSGRKILDAQAAILKSMVGAGIKPVKSFNFIAKEVGGIRNVGFTKKDCHNFLCSMRKSMIEAGDGQTVINHFKRKQVEDPLFFYSMQVDQKNRMANFFWRDGRSKLDYDLFGDAVIFDTTFRTNRYNLICAPFVGINHHWKNVLFGCAFLVDETTESFIWLFETFLEAMGGRQPTCIFTDQDQAMANAIKVVFPESRHRLCQWHLSNNAKKNLSGIYGNPEFCGRFHKCLTGCLDEIEFQSTWTYMINKFNLQDNAWLKRLYESREKWSTAFSLDIFTARMKSTQRSESTNSVFQQVLGTSLSLIQVISFYEEKVENMRQQERDDDFNCKNGFFGDLISQGGILGHAATIYTTKIFTMLETEFLSGMGLSCKEAKREGLADDVLLYEVCKCEGKRVLTVMFHKTNLSISCSCKLFETLGILCRHALRVLVVNNVNEIPIHYILRRWTKDAKKGARDDSIAPSAENEKSARLLRYSELTHLGLDIFDKASFTIEDTRIVKRKLLEIVKLIEKDDGNQKSTQELPQNNTGNVVTEKISEDICMIRDPPVVRTKGMTNARIKSSLEKKKPKKAKGKNTQRQEVAHVSEPVQVQIMNLDPPVEQNGNQFQMPTTIEVPNQGDYQNALSLHPYSSYMEMLQNAAGLGGTHFAFK